MLWSWECCGIGDRLGTLWDWAPQEKRSPPWLGVGPAALGALQRSTDTKEGGTGRYKLCFSGGAVTTAAGWGQHSALIIISTKAPLEPEPGVTAAPAGSSLWQQWIPGSTGNSSFFTQYPPAPLQRRVLHLVGSCLATVKEAEPAPAVTPPWAGSPQPLLCPWDGFGLSLTHLDTPDPAASQGCCPAGAVDGHPMSTPTLLLIPWAAPASAAGLGQCWEVTLSHCVPLQITAFQHRTTIPSPPPEGLENHCGITPPAPTSAVSQNQT